MPVNKLRNCISSQTAAAHTIPRSTHTLHLLVRVASVQSANRTDTTKSKSRHFHFPTPARGPCSLSRLKCAVGLLAIKGELDLTTRHRREGSSPSRSQLTHRLFIPGIISHEPCGPFDGVPVP